MTGWQWWLDGPFVVDWFGRRPVAIAAPILDLQQLPPAQKFQSYLPLLLLLHQVVPISHGFLQVAALRQVSMGIHYIRIRKRRKGIQEQSAGNV